MPTLGSVITANEGSDYFVANVCTVSGIPGASNPGGTLDSVTCWLNDAGGSDDFRLGIWEGDSDSDPVGAALIWASGRLDGAGYAREWVTITAGGETLTAGKTIWIGIAGQGSCWRVRSPDAENGDYPDLLHRFAHTVASVALPSTIPTIDATNAYTLKSYLTYTASGASAVLSPEPVDLTAVFDAVVIRQGAMSGQIDLGESQTSILAAASAIQAAADFGATWATIATRIATTTENIDLSDSWDGGSSAIQGVISADVTLAATFAETVTAAASLSAGIDLSSSQTTVLQALASVTDSMDLTDVQSSLMMAGASFSEAVALADSWFSTAGEIAAAVRIVVAARNRRIVPEARDRLIVVNARQRRIPVKKLN